MSQYLVTKSLLDSLANAVATKAGTYPPMTIAEMTTAVANLPSGATLQAKSNISPTTSSQTITPDQGYDGLSSVQINAMPFGSVTAPATISGSGATVSAATNTLTLTKTVSVTPSVTTAGYVSAGTAGNSSVDLTASIPTQTAQTYNPQAADRTIASGTYLLGTQTIKGAPLQSKTVTSNGTVYPDTGYYGLSDVVVNVGGSTGAQVDIVSTTPSSAAGYIQFEDLKGEPTSLAVIARGDIATASSEKVAAVVWDGSTPIALFGQKITNTSNAQVSYTDGAFSASYSSGVLTIYASGVDFQPIQYDLVYSYSGSASAIGTKDVQVGSGATSITFTGLEDEPIYWSCVFKSNFSTSSGYQRVIAVVYDGTNTYGLEMDSGAHAATHWTSTYSNGSLTITSNGTNQGGYFHQPGYYQLTYAVGEPSPYQKKSVTYTPTTSQQTATITADTGYDALSQVNVTVNAMPTMTLPNSASATSSGTSKATITPGSSVQYLNIPTGYNGTAQYYTIGASGGGGGSLTVATKTLTLTAVSQTLSFTSLSGQPKYWFVRCTSNVSSSGSTTYYYVTDAFYDGTNIKGNTFRIGSTRRVQNITSGISQSYSGGTLTITAGSSSGATPGQFYGASNVGYELVYIY